MYLTLQIVTFKIWRQNFLTQFKTQKRVTVALVYKCRRALLNPRCLLYLLPLLT